MLTDNAYIIRNKQTKAVIMETRDQEKINALNTSKYEAIPVLQHLQEINQDI